MAGVRCEKRGHFWQYVFDGAKIDGKRNRITKCGFRTKAEAADAGTKAMAEYNEAGIRFTPSQMSYYDFLEHWLNSYCSINLKQVTIENYQKKINYHIKPELGIYKLASLSAVALQDFIDKKAKQNYSRNTLSVLKGILSGSLNFAVKQSLIKYNPMYSVKLPSPRNESIRSRVAPHVYIPPERITQIFNRFTEGSSAYLPLLIGYKCGMRLGEVFALSWDCINLEVKTITINKQVQWNKLNQSWYFTNPKYDSFRTIEIDNDLVEILRREKEKQNKAKKYYGVNYILNFIDKDRNLCYNNENKLVNLVLIRENGSYIQPRIMQHTSEIIHHKLNYLDFTFHSLRHTHATMLAEKNAPIKYVQKRLGHKNIQVTLQIYQHLTTTISSNGVAILENIFTDPRSKIDNTVACLLPPHELS